MTTKVGHSQRASAAVMQLACVDPGLRRDDGANRETAFSGSIRQHSLLSRPHSIAERQRADLIPKCIDHSFLCIRKIRRITPVDLGQASQQLDVLTTSMRARSAVLVMIKLSDTVPKPGRSSDVDDLFVSIPTLELGFRQVLREVCWRLRKGDDINTGRGVAYRTAPRHGPAHFNRSSSKKLGNG